MIPGQPVVDADLERLHEDLNDVFRTLAGSELLMTGGAGFLGYYMVQAPLTWNHAHPELEPIRLTVYDNMLRGVPDWLGRLESDTNLALRTYDLREPLPAAMPDFDYVVHAAGIASPRYYRRHPIETMDANITGLRSLLDRAVEQGSRHPISGFLFFSSSEIYGDPPPDEIPTSEEYRGNVSCIGPRACYDESKRYGETLCVNFARVYDIPVSIARPFNNYGPGMKITDGRVIADFARNIIAGEDIVMYSDGAPTRTFCYATDAVAGYYRALVLGGPGEPYNVGTTSPEISMSDLADRMVRIAGDELGYAGSVVHQVSTESEYLTDNPSRRCPSIDKARRELGYSPEVDLDEGLRRTLLWYSANPGGEEK